jgi:hypothetical protein
VIGMTTVDFSDDVIDERFVQLMQKTGLVSCHGPLTSEELHRQLHDCGLTDDDKFFLRTELVRRKMLRD